MRLDFEAPQRDHCVAGLSTMSILLFINLKGGVAKTTNAVAVSECLASQGHRVLLIDADHQCMAGELVLGEETLLRCENRRRTLHDLLLAMLDDGFDAEKIAGYVSEGPPCRSGGPSVSVMPCSIRIDDFQTNVAKARLGFKSNDEFGQILRRRRDAIRRWLRERYDYTIIDCPPSIPQQVKLFLTIADAYLIPSIPDRLSVRGSLWLVERIRKLNVKIPALGLLWTLYRVQNPVHRKILESSEAGVAPFDQLPVPFSTVIPNAASIAEASEVDHIGCTFTARYGSRFAGLYRDLCGEILTRCRRLEPSRTARG